MTGNLALKDVELGLKWIKDNISKFGGDPKSITLIGSGGGAAITNLIMLTKKTSKKLKHREVLNTDGEKKKFWRKKGFWVKKFWGLQSFWGLKKVLGLKSFSVSIIFWLKKVWA